MIATRNRFPRLAWLVLAAAVADSPPAQEPKPRAEPGAPQVTVLGEVERTTVVLGDVDAQGPVTQPLTVFDVVMSAGCKRTGNLEKVLVLRPTGDALLVVDVDIKKMITTGNTLSNVPLRDRDVVIVPSKQAATAGQDLFAALVPVGLAAALPDRDRAVVLAWCFENTTNAKQLHDFIGEIAKLGALSRVASKSLVAKLDGEVTLAREAATALGMLGVGGRAALDDLRRCTSHEDAQLRERAKASVRQIEKAIAAQKATEPVDKNEAGKSKE